MTEKWDVLVVIVASNDRISGKWGTLGKRVAMRTRRELDAGSTETRRRRPCTLSSDDVVRVTESTRQMSLPKGTASLDG